MTEYERLIEEMDIFAKAKVYNHYMVTMVTLRHSFQWWLEPQMKHLNPDYLWKDMKRQDFTEFISKDNILITDLGPDWEKNGFAQQFKKDYNGIYDWYWKFKDKI